MLAMADEELNEFDKDPSEGGMSFHATLSEINEALEIGLIYTNPKIIPGGMHRQGTLKIKDANGGIGTVNFIFNVFASEHVDLSATQEKDVLFGTGNADTFVFQPNMSRDTILDFAGQRPDPPRMSLRTLLARSKRKKSFNAWATDHIQDVARAAWKSISAMTR